MKDRQSDDSRRDNQRHASSIHRSLKDRISSTKGDHDRRSSTFSNGRIINEVASKGSSPYARPESRKNPLYSLLDGRGNPKAITTHIKTQDRPAALDNESKRTPVSRQYESRNRPDVVIRGRGSAANSFSIRGASSTSVSIQNLAPGTTEADVCHILNNKIGEVEGCKTFHVRGGLSTTAEVKFGSRIAAESAIRMFHGVLADNKRLDVSILVEPTQQASPTDVRSTDSNARTVDRSPDVYSMKGRTTIRDYELNSPRERQTERNSKNRDPDLFIKGTRGWTQDQHRLARSARQ